MFAFLNERSLEKYNNWAASLRLFLVAAQELAKVATVLFRDSDFFSSGYFAKQFSSLSFPKDERALIQEIAFGTRYYKCWRPQRISSAADTFACVIPVMQLRDDSICEATERKLADATISIRLLSAADSAFHSDPLNVSKESTNETVELTNDTSIQGVRRWIAAQRGYYDRTSHSAPKDFQTVLLKATERFRTTAKFERRFSRRVFEEVTTCRLYYVDEGHVGHSAHLEVFSPQHEHLGTADIDTGDLNAAERVHGRTLRL
jgi:hypothetical protein